MNVQIPNMAAQQVVSALQLLANPDKAKHSYLFFKAIPGGYGYGDRFLGISVPPQRKIAKQHLSISLKELEKLLRNPYHEIRLTALFIACYKVEKAGLFELDEIAALYLKNIAYINNWDLIDLSSPNILGRFLEHKERDLLYALAESKSVWEKRISILTCFYFIKKNDFEDALAISELLINDEHDLIHKAVGWMLREIGKRDQLVEENFLKQYYLLMPRTMLRYAIEKFDEPLRKKYLTGEI